MARSTGRRTTKSRKRSHSKRRSASKKALPAKWADGSIGEGKSKSIYLEPQTNDTAVLIAYFNPVGYKRPLKNLLYIQQILKEKNIPCYIAECVFRGRRPEVPGANLVLQSNSYMFYKESLLNTLEKNLPAMYTKLILLDGDVVFDTPDWIDQISEKLETTDIIHPFQYACWLYPDNTRVRVKKESHGYAITTGKSLEDFYKYHPGFCWAIRRDFFQKIGGLFDRCIVGRGDVAFVLSLVTTVPEEAMRRILDIPMIADSWAAFRQRLQAAQPRIGYLEGEVYHLFHGLQRNRQYESRYSTMKTLQIPWDAFVYTNKDGLYEFKDPNHNKWMLEYFKGRNEDIPLRIAMLPPASSMVNTNAPQPF